MAAVPSRGRAERVERPAEPGCDATRSLYERFSAQIMGYCLHQLGSREEAEDAVQTTFMNALRGLRRGIVPEVESAWLFKIAHNVCLSRRRSTWRRGKVEAPNNLEVLQEVVPAQERLSDELIRLPEVLEEMPESQRRAILLREWQGLSYREIADELGLSQSAVETLIFRARRALAAGLEVVPEHPSWRKRARHGIDAGGLLAALKALLTGGTAAKVAATVAVATTTALAVSGGTRHVVRQTHAHATPPPQTQHVSLQPRATRPAPAAAPAPRRRLSVAAVHPRSSRPSHSVAPPAPAAERDRIAPPPTAPAMGAKAEGDATKPQATVTHDGPPATHKPRVDAVVGSGNPGKAHEKPPPVHEPKAEPQLPPAATNDPPGGGGPPDDAGHGGGNGHK